MPLDLDVPARFATIPGYRTLGETTSFRDHVVVPVPCDVPGQSVVPICLDTDQLRVGDVFLFHRSNVAGRIIELYQRAWCGLTKRAARISHVAVYGGGGMIWDHNPGQNVRLRTVSSALQLGSTISVARPDTSDIDKARLTKICAHLQSQVNYNLLSATNWRAVLARSGKRRIREDVTNEVPPALVCSSFIATALDYASKSKFTIPEPVVLPGDFVREDRFISLDIEWCRVSH